MVAQSQRIFPVLLSGGAGSRLWPLSRDERPKQLLPLLDERTLLQQTASRVADPDRFAALTVIAAAQHRAAVGEQLRGIGARIGSIVLEPAGRNTAAAAAVAALLLNEDGGNPLLLLMPSDHCIKDAEPFLRDLDAAAPIARDGSLVLFGIRPDRPATGYGYIRVGAPLPGAGRASKAAAFTEKPERHEAERYLQTGGYLWNSGIFLLSAEALAAELARYEPEVLRWSRAALETGRRDGDTIWLDPQSFDRCPSTSLDRAVMERTEHAVVMPADFDWTDVGSWSTLWEMAERDEAGNATVGSVIAEKTRGSYLRSEGPLIATLGVENLVVIATPDVILVADKAHDQEVRRLVDRWRTGKLGGP